MKVLRRLVGRTTRGAAAAMLAVGLVTGAVSAQEDVEVAFPGNIHSTQLFDANSALMTNPVGVPPNAVHWEWDRTRAQSILEARFPSDRQVVAPLTIEGAHPLAEPPLLRIETPGSVLTIEEGR